MDTMTPEQRKRCMSSIKSRDTKPEMIVRRWLWHQGLRYRLHVKSLPGTPDIVMRKLRTVVFVHGCFWHGHDECQGNRLPATRHEYWKNKIEANRKRDERDIAALTAMGWHVIVVWECKLKKSDRLMTLLSLSRSISQIVLAKNHAKPMPSAPLSYPEILTEHGIAAEDTTEANY